jgi:hypothetical protein
VANPRAGRLEEHAGRGTREEGRVYSTSKLAVRIISFGLGQVQDCETKSKDKMVWVVALCCLVESVSRAGGNLIVSNWVGALVRCRNAFDWVKQVLL